MMSQIITEIPRLHTAIAEWLACMIFIRILKKKVRGWKLIALSLVMFFVQAVFLMLTGKVNMWLWIPCMTVAVLFMILFIFVCTVGSIYDAIYCGLHAFIIAEFAASLEWQINCFFLHGNESRVQEYLSMVPLLVVIFLVIERLWRKPKLTNQVLQVHPNELIAVLITAVAVFTISNVSFLPIWTPFSEVNNVTIANVRTMVDFAGVAMIYAYYAQKCELRTRQELNVMQNVLQNQYLQYQQSKESIDLINYKYHDLKHQIAALRAEENSERRSAFLDEMEADIHRYEVQNKTGNKVVDTILTSKNVICEQYHISLNCVIDGSLLNFMDTLDLCSIFGNALDNAIECEKQIPEQEKRLIHVAVFAQKNFVIMRFENYFNGELQMQDGLPTTTKTKKKEFHGFGIKSIRYTVQKYEGAVNISQRENWFELKILLPLKKSV